MACRPNTVCCLIPFGPYAFAKNIELTCDTEYVHIGIVLNNTFHFYNAQTL